ncbi:MAG: hypothetical protein KAH48_05525 [Chlorobi bacterium]|nr:hypothetical protein [Chlorobiota bacterium]
MSYDCTEIDKTQSPTLCEQAERFVDKLYNYPDDWECILETDYYVDCSKYLVELRKNEYLYRRAGYRIKRYSYGQLKERKTKSFVGFKPETLYVFTDKIFIPNPGDNGPPVLRQYFGFKIIDKQRLELIEIM